MGKYKVGDELIVISDPSEEKVKLRELTKLTTDGELNKVFAECKDIENFDHEMVLEKALLKAFTNEIINISVVKNSSHCKR